MKNGMIMTYFEYHNLHAQTFAFTMYGRSYDTLRILEQLTVDDAICARWECIPFTLRNALQG